MTAIIITGNPVDGFDVSGPFATSMDAIDWAEDHFDNIRESWWVSKLTPIDELETSQLTIVNNAQRDVGEKVWALVKGTIRSEHWMEIDDGSNKISIPMAQTVAAQSVEPGFRHNAIVKERNGTQWLVDKKQLQFRNLDTMETKEWDEVQRPLIVIYTGTR